MRRTNAPRVLYIEDHEDTRELVTLVLEQRSYEVVTGSTITSGVALAASQHFDLYLLDSWLPDGSGLDLIGRLRTADGLATRVDPTLPVIVLSGRTGDLDRIRGFERGADDFVPKPFSYGELRLRIAALLRRAERRPGLGRLTVGGFRRGRDRLPAKQWGRSG